MDEARKNAYRRILYTAMLDFRGHHPVGPQDDRMPWAIWKWPATRRRLREIQVMADWLHNLAQFASDDFMAFKEAWFWREYHSLTTRFPRLLQRLERTRYQFEFEWCDERRAYVQVRTIPASNESTAPPV